ncbi:MAG: phage head-tail joining protein [Aeromonas veronii]
MAYTQAQLDALDAAIASGALSVRYADQQVTYRSLQEMQAIRDKMAAALDPSKKNFGSRYLSGSKGL